MSQFVTAVGVVLSVAGREGLPVPDEGRGSDEFDQRDNPPQFPFHPDYTTPSSIKHDLLLCTELALFHSIGK